MDRFFKTVQRINSLAILIALLAVLAGIAWALVNDYKKSTSTVRAPNETIGSSLFYSLTMGDYLEQNGIQILRLDASGKQKLDYEGHHSQTRNLLLISENRPTALWLFKDQSQRIDLVEKLPKPEGEKAKALYIEVTPLIKTDSLDGTEDNLTIYLAKPNGDKPLAILKKVDKVIGRKLVGDMLHLIYQQGLSVRNAQISIIDFKMQSDQEVAKMTNVGSGH